MKKILPLIAIFFLAFIYISIPIPHLTDEIPKDIPVLVNKVPEIQVHPIIEEINERNSKIHTAYTDNVEFYIKNRITIRCRGMLAFEKIPPSYKENNFHLILNSVAGKEIDIGSNASQFWFWSKRMSPRALYYAKNEDLYKTRLKTLFHRMFIMESLCLSEIKTENSEFFEDSSFLKIKQKKPDPRGKSVEKIIVIDKQKKLIVEQYILEDGICIASVKIDYKGNLPSHIVTQWHTEGKTCEWFLKNWQINRHPFAPGMFDLPNITPKINMSEN